MAGRAGQVDLSGRYAAVVTVDTVTNTVTNIVGINTRWSRHQWQRIADKLPKIQEGYRYTKNYCP